MSIEGNSLQRLEAALEALNQNRRDIENDLIALRKCMDPQNPPIRAPRGRPERARWASPPSVNEEERHGPARRNHFESPPMLSPEDIESPPAQRRRFISPPTPVKEPRDQKSTRPNRFESPPSPTEVERPPAQRRRFISPPSPVREPQVPKNQRSARPNRFESPPSPQEVGSPPPQRRRFISPPTPVKEPRDQKSTRPNRFESPPSPTEVERPPARRRRFISPPSPVQEPQVPKNQRSARPNRFESPPSPQEVESPPARRRHFVSPPGPVEQETQVPRRSRFVSPPAEDVPDVPTAHMVAPEPTRSFKDIEDSPDLIIPAAEEVIDGFINDSRPRNRKNFIYTPPAEAHRLMIRNICSRQQGPAHPLEGYRPYKRPAEMDFDSLAYPENLLPPLEPSFTEQQLENAHWKVKHADYQMSTYQEKLRFVKGARLTQLEWELNNINILTDVGKELEELKEEILPWAL